MSAATRMGHRRKERLTAPCVGVDMVAVDCQRCLEG